MTHILEDLNNKMKGGKTTFQSTLTDFFCWEYEGAGHGYTVTLVWVRFTITVD